MRALVIEGVLRVPGANAFFFERGSPRENGQNESFSGELRDESLVRMNFFGLQDAPILVEARRARSSVGSSIGLPLHQGLETRTNGEPT